MVKLFFQMEMLEAHLKKLFFQMEKVLLQMIRKPERLGIWCHRMERGDLGVGEVSEPLIKVNFMIALRLRRVIGVVKIADRRLKTSGYKHSCKERKRDLKKREPTC